MFLALFLLTNGKKGRVMRLSGWTAPLVGVVLGFCSISGASAGACPSTPSCTAGGVTFTLTDPGEGANGVEIDGSALTFLAWFDSSNQSPDTIEADTLAFLSAEYGVTAEYFGRATGEEFGASGWNSTGTEAPGTSFNVKSSDHGLSGTWSFNPGSTDNLPTVIVMHAGGGHKDVIYAINSPGLSGIWDTSENINGGGNQAKLSNFDVFGGTGVGVQGGCLPNFPCPEPLTISLFGAGLLGAFSLRRRRQAAV